MLERFRERIIKNGKLMVKTRTAFVRKARRGETVLTYVNGRVTSTTNVQDDNSYVVQNPTIDHELYVLPRAKFEANWVTPGDDIQEDSTRCTPVEAKQLKPVPLV